MFSWKLKLKVVGVIDFGFGMYFGVWIVKIIGFVRLVSIEEIWVWLREGRVRFYFDELEFLKVIWEFLEVIFVFYDFYFWDL